jgi:hypothetical protein
MWYVGRSFRDLGLALACCVETGGRLDDNVGVGATQAKAAHADTLITILRPWYWFGGDSQISLLEGNCGISWEGLDVWRNCSVFQRQNSLQDPTRLAAPPA